MKAWMALHTNPNVEPHCTLAWTDQANFVHMRNVFIQVQRFLGGPLTVRVAGHEKFGIRKDTLVAVLESDFRLEQAVGIASEVNRSEFPTRPHVTKHFGDMEFTFDWLGLHFPTAVHYERLDAERWML